ncbi:MAG: sodium:calcium antiporter [Halobacteriovoraceae bacterium]|nr:sodium:calcium antiporter [Halobacteriovoraceae bacterium]
MIYQFFFLILSLIIIFFGAKWTLESAEKIGLYFNLPALLIGILIIGFGTSLPEFFVCHLAVWDGREGIALGNILGSNIANIYFIMGLVGILSPLYFDKKIHSQLFWHLGSTVLLILVILRKKLDIYAFFIFSVFFAIYLYRIFQSEKQQEKENGSIKFMDIIKLILGFISLYGGGKLLVSSGGRLAELMDISEYVVSAIFVALGTSFPELATALLAWRKKKNLDLIIGNIIGSNIFNVLFVLASLGFYKISIPQNYFSEQILLLFAALVLIYISFRKKVFFRMAGSLFFCLYCLMIYMWTAKLSF